MRARRPGWTGLATGAETEGDDGSILADERDRVGDGGNGDKLEEAGDEDITEAVFLRRRSGVGSEESVGQFEGYAGAAEILLG